jgi:hypothetical protein
MNATPDDRADHERDASLAAEHVAELGGLIQQRVERNADEVHEHELDDGAKTGRGSAHAGADEAHLGDRRVPYAAGSELRAQPLGHAHDSAPGLLDALVLAALAAREVLSDQDHVRVARHRDRHRLVEGLAVENLSHQLDSGYDT